MNFQLVELPYLATSDSLLFKLQDYGDLIAFESKGESTKNSRWSVIAAGPISKITAYQADDFSVTRDQLKELSHLAKSIDSKTYGGKALELPFTGGILGASSYDFGSPHLNYRPASEKSPLLFAGLYAWAYLIDHLERKTFVVNNADISTREINDLVILLEEAIRECKSTAHPLQISSFTPAISQEQYQTGFKHIKSYISSGDTYQVNYTHPFQAKFTGNPLAGYCNLKKQSQSPYLAYLESDNNLAIASMSPELFLAIEHDNVSTKPIKGTAPRATDKQQDEKNALKLKNSKKDNAENLMIVDLLRNDLSINCNNIKVPEFLKIESFELVHHLVSKITGIMKPEADPIDVFLDAFPGGSITGAPKKRAMEIIEELEIEPRGFYCGSAFLFSNNGKHQSNILIRTFTFQDEIVTCNAGGGIVADSTWESEYQESLDKISRLMEVLEG